MNAKFNVVIGTGGIGSGITMRLHGDHSLGREESRAVTLLDAQDYCKLHIVLHYVQRLLGPAFPVVPVGAVGDDEPGRAALEEMAETGMDTTWVRTIPGADTLFAVSFSYPNGDGGNLTTLNSASDQVTAGDVCGALQQPHRAPGISIALPEVPFDARVALLRHSPEGFLRIAAFVPGEASEAISSGVLADIDLIALNADEARAFSGNDTSDGESLTRSTIAALTTHNAGLRIVVTAGESGSWSWDGTTLAHARYPARTVESTAGAGDSHLGGIVTALVSGSGLHEANRFGALVSSMKVSSTHAINHDIDAASVLAEADRRAIQLPGPLEARLRGLAARSPDGTASRQNGRASAQRG